MTDANLLYKGYLRSVKASKWKDSTQRVMQNYLKVIFKLQKDLYNQTYVPGQETEFILNERGKIRAITSLQTRDRIVRHVLCDDILTPRIRKKIIYDNGASLENRGISFTRRRFEKHLRDHVLKHGRNGVVGFGDFSKFYDNIIHYDAKLMLLNLCNQDEYLSWLLDQIFTHFRIDISDAPKRVVDRWEYGVFDKNEYRAKYKSTRGKRYLHKSVNIGDQLSQDLGIYYPHEMDNYIKIVRGIKGYDRYMDDFAVIVNSRDEALDLLYSGGNIMAKHGLTLNKKKTNTVQLNEPFTFLQTKYYICESGHIEKRINPKTVTRLRQRLKKLAYKVENEGFPYVDVENMFKSCMGNDAPLMSKLQRENMIELYEDLFGVRVLVTRNKIEIEKRKNGSTRYLE